MGGFDCRFVCCFYQCMPPTYFRQFQYSLGLRRKPYVLRCRTSHYHRSCICHFQLYTQNQSICITTVCHRRHLSHCHADNRRIDYSCRRFTCLFYMAGLQIFQHLGYIHCRHVQFCHNDGGTPYNQVYLHSHHEHRQGKETRNSIGFGHKFILPRLSSQD